MELVESVDHQPFVERVALGTGTAIAIAVWKDATGVVHIAIEGKGYYSFGHFAHWGYVMEKLFNGKFPPDAKAVANFINAVLGYDEGHMVNPNE